MSLPRPRIRHRPDPQFRSAFLHSIGLGAVNNLIDHLRGYRNRPEPKKRIVEESIKVALQRCGVHLLPCAVSLIIISINLKGYFIGFELAGLPGQTPLSMAMLQVAAKVQELLIVASLTTVVAHKVRYDMISGHGVPFGLVGASSLFTQLSFFWSSTFFGSFTRKFKLNAALVVLVAVSGFIAATAGPAIAILVIPREHIWPAGGTTYFMNGTYDDLWPSQIGLEHYIPAAGFGNSTANCTETNSYTNALCPAGGYLALIHRINSGPYWSSYSGPKDSTYSPMNLLGSGEGITVFSPSGQMEPYTLVTSIRDSKALESSAIAVHGPSSWVAKRLGEDWFGATYRMKINERSPSSRYKFYTTMKSIVKAFVPAVRVVCSSPQPLKLHQHELSFPWVPDFEPAVAIGTHGRLRELRNMKLNDSSLDTLAFSQYPRIHRVDLSEQHWTNSTTGVIIEYPWTSNHSRNVSGCVVDARWAKGKVFYEYSTAVQPAIDSMKHRGSDGYYINDMFRPKPGGEWRRINISKDLFYAVIFPGAFLAPSKSQTHNLTQTEALMKAFNWNKEWVSEDHLYETEQMISAVFADAIARAGSWRTVSPTEKRKSDWELEILNGGEAYEKPIGPSDAYTSIRMDQQITGYAFKASSITDYMALVVVFAHLAIATGHTVLMLYTRQSSACWDSYPELLTLAMQSLPSETALKNTAAGIFTSRVFGHTTRIRVHSDDKEHVVLALDKDDRGDTLQKPDVLQKYG